jgi:hypothetical protein
MEKEKKNGFVEFVFSNFGFKVLAFALAIFTFVVINM